MADAIATKKCPTCGGDQFVKQEVPIMTLEDVSRNSIYEPYPILVEMVQYQYTCINPECSEDLA